jgi:hypothetical protein
MRYIIVAGNFIVFSFLFLVRGWSQELICSAGDVFSNASVQMEWSLGECVIETYFDEEIMLSQGFHQPNLIRSAETDYKIIVYPNPYDLNLFIEILELESDQMYGQICDMAGKLIFTLPNLLNYNKIITSEMSDGIYLLRIYDSHSRILKTVKIVKLFQL